MTLTQSFQAGGPFMWLVALCGIGLLIVAVWKGIQLFSGSETTPERRKQGMALIYQFGLLGFVLGVLAQVVGLMNALQAIQQAADVSPGIIVGGLRISFIAPLFGLLVLVFSLIIWTIFRQRANRLMWLRDQVHDPRREFGIPHFIRNIREF